MNLLPTLPALTPRDWLTRAGSDLQARALWRLLHDPCAVTPLFESKKPRGSMMVRAHHHPQFVIQNRRGYASCLSGAGRARGVSMDCHGVVPTLRFFLSA